MELEVEKGYKLVRVLQKKAPKMVIELWGDGVLRRLGLTSLENRYKGCFCIVIFRFRDDASINTTHSE